MGAAAIAASGAATRESLQSAVTRGHLEESLGNAVLLGSAKEFVDILKAYAGHLAKTAGFGDGRFVGRRLSLRVDVDVRPSLVSSIQSKVVGDFYIRHYPGYCGGNCVPRHLFVSHPSFRPGYFALIFPHRGYCRVRALCDKLLLASDPRSKSNGDGSGRTVESCKTGEIMGLRLGDGHSVLGLSKIDLLQDVRMALGSG